MDFYEWVQTRLITHGFDPGLVDGVWGRKTRSATIAFQTHRGIPADGRLTDSTILALRAGPGGTKDSGTATPPRHLLDLFPWMDLALRKKGLHEGKDNKELRKFLKSDGSTLGDPAKLPWCGDLVETCLAVTLPEAILPANPYLARNWLKFGKTVDPCFGAVMVFWRETKASVFGHVAFYYSEDEHNYILLGGNQNNQIGLSAYRKDRLLGARLPEVGGPWLRKVIRSEDDWRLAPDEE